jgi:catechol 2,3-dioxygenase-like lactoylglutathione lyase family enzyme
MKRLHMHIMVDDLERAAGFYSDLFAARPCCRGARYVNWRIDDPALNLAVSLAPVGLARAIGAVHFGLEVDSSADLRPIDRVLQGPSRSAAAVPWEVSVRKQPVRRERTP